jgi:hypothetical protein
MNRTVRERDSGKNAGHPTLSKPELSRARLELAHTLRTILLGDGENELNRLLLDMCEADQLQPYKHEGVRCWQAAGDFCFGSRKLDFEDETRAEIASLFFDRLLVFSVEVGTRLEVRWIASEMRPRPN